MIKHTFLDKANTIFKGSKLNHGLNPVAEINYGKKVSRALIHFDESELRQMDEDGCFPDKTKLKHVLKLTNCMSQDGVPYEKDLNDGGMGIKSRAVSFDIVLYLLPKDFDAGRGFNSSSDTWLKNDRSISTKGSNWYYASTNNPWRSITVSSETIEDITVINTYKVDERGMYTADEIAVALEVYMNNILHEENNDTFVVGIQHFDFGNENFEFDITEVVNKFFTGELVNHGFGLAFAPRLEDSNEENQEYVGFFTDRTNTFFHPYVETIYEDYIRDDRAQFYIGKTNRIYLYAVIDGEYTNLDALPTCTIDDEVTVPVKCGGKGIYYAEIEPSAMELEPNTIHYDKWSKIALNGQEMDEVELEFVALPAGKYFQIGAGLPHKDIVVPQVYGINNDEKIRQGEVRRVVVDCRKKYTTDKKELIDSAEYRIYVKDANREIEVYQYQPVEKTFMENFFYVNTGEMIPNEYFVDVRIKANGETRHYREVLKFTVISDITEYYL